MAEEKKRRPMPEFAHGLLGDEADGEDSGDEGVDEAEDMHPGLAQASRDMLDAAQADDHEGHARALSNFLDIHKHKGKSKKKDADGDYDGDKDEDDRY